MEQTKRLSTLVKKISGLHDITVCETGGFPELIGTLRYNLRLLHVVKHPFSEFTETRVRKIGLAIAIQTRLKLSQAEKNWVKKFVADGGIWLPVNNFTELQEELDALQEQLKGVTA